MSVQEIPDDIERMREWLSRADTGHLKLSADPIEERLRRPLTATGEVPLEWIDANQHMNSLMYLIAMRDASAQIFRLAGLGPDYIGTSSIFQRELHMTFFRELRLGAPFVVRGWIVGLDERDIHSVIEMSHGEEGWRAAAVEFKYGHVDFVARRSSAWPDDMRSRFQTMLDASAETLPRDLISRAIRTRI
jgi:acyl-CoA thioesterase FadM